MRWEDIYDKYRCRAGTREPQLYQRVFAWLPVRAYVSKTSGDVGYVRVWLEKVDRYYCGYGDWRYFLCS